MKTHLKNLQKRCAYCRRYFKPDKRVKERQKSCKREICQKKRKQENQRKWVKSNLEYFKNHYNDYVKAWRKRHPEYQKQWRQKRREIKDEMHDVSNVKRITLVIPKKLLKCKIKDEIRVVTYCKCGSYVVRRAG